MPINTSKVYRFYLVNKGRFEWQIGNQDYTMYPGNIAIILPGQQFGSKKGHFDIGKFSWLFFQTPLTKKSSGHSTTNQGSLAEKDKRIIVNLLKSTSEPVLPKFTDGARIFQNLKQEVFNQEVGFVTRVHQLIDELFILSARKTGQKRTEEEGMTQLFIKLEQALRQNVSKFWTVEEMARIVELGTTAFNEKIKKHTGFSPFNFLIHIRISEAIKLLQKSDLKITDIALNSGFNSSQHFATTFKKMTGYTPREMRNNA